MKGAHDEDRTANDRLARRQFVSKCRSRGLEVWRSAADLLAIAISLGYRDTNDCDRCFDPRIVCKAQVGYQSN
eukprot:3752493-Pleurochrysis_carterae.AAC.1